MALIGLRPPGPIANRNGPQPDIVALDLLCAERQRHAIALGEVDRTVEWKEGLAVDCGRHSRGVRKSEFTVTGGIEPGAQRMRDTGADDRDLAGASDADRLIRGVVDLEE